MGSKANTQSESHLTAPTRLTGAEIIWATLVGEGVSTVFGYPGGAILPCLRRAAQVSHSSCPRSS